MQASHPSAVHSQAVPQSTTRLYACHSAQPTWPGVAWLRNVSHGPMCGLASSPADFVLRTSRPA
eukprot:2706705-Prymnesium_polylepis.2